MREMCFWHQQGNSEGNVLLALQKAAFVITVESHNYAPPLLCMLALGNAREGAYYLWDSDMYMLRPLPTDKCQVGVRSLHFLRLFDGQNLRKVTK